MQDHKGFVLLIVLWWLALLALLITQITLSGRTDSAIAANIRGNAIAETAADGAVNEAIFQVLTRQWAADGVVHFVHSYRATAEVRIDDEADKVDPNVAPVVLMQALLRACGAIPQVATRLATAISDWHSVDVLQAATAETTPQYAVAGLSYLPPHARFVGNDELGLVVGMTPELLACLNPHLSVYSSSVPTLQTTSDPIVRQALLEAYPDDIALAATSLGHPPAVVRITAAAQEAAGARAKFRRVAVVRVTPTASDDNFVYKILSWEEAGS